MNSKFLKKLGLILLVLIGFIGLVFLFGFDFLRITLANFTYIGIKPDLSLVVYLIFNSLTISLVVAIVLFILVIWLIRSGRSKFLKNPVNRNIIIILLCFYLFASIFVIGYAVKTQYKIFNDIYTLIGTNTKSQKKITFKSKVIGFSWFIGTEESLCYQDATETTVKKRDLEQNFSEKNINFKGWNFDNEYVYTTNIDYNQSSYAVFITDQLISARLGDSDTTYFSRPQC